MIDLKNKKKIPAVHISFMSRLSKFHLEVLEMEFILKFFNSEKQVSIFFRKRPVNAKSLKSFAAAASSDFLK